MAILAGFTRGASGGDWGLRFWRIECCIESDFGLRTAEALVLQWIELILSLSVCIESFFQIFTIYT